MFIIPRPVYHPDAIPAGGGDAAAAAVGVTARAAGCAHTWGATLAAAARAAGWGPRSALAARSDIVGSDGIARAVLYVDARQFNSNLAAGLEAALLQSEAGAQPPPGDSWLAQLKAPPVDGKANEELIALVAQQFACAKSKVHIKSGASSKTKRVLIED
jgi:hypothetical protein